MNLTVHNVYFCFSEVGCTISLRDGTPCKEVPAHTPTLFVAQQPDMVCSDPAAVVKEIPNGLQLLHGQMMKEQATWKLKYAKCVTVDDMLSVNADYKNDLTSDGTWVYPLTELQIAREAFKNAGLVGFEGELPKLSDGFGMFLSSNLTSFNIKLPMLESGQSMFQNSPITYFDSDLPEMWLGAHMFYRAKLTSFNTKLPKLNNAGFMFGKNSGLSSFNAELPKLSLGDSMFNECIFNKESALRILNSIPAYSSGSHPLTIGIHVDHKYDPEVNLALKKADINYEPTVELPEEVTEGKGWTIAVQWNGTPTSTASTMAMGQLVYAKVSTHELPDGTNEQYLDWGHYVTDWEARGYEQFRSLSSAYRYFNLPEEDLTNN